MKATTDAHVSASRTVGWVIWAAAACAGPALMLWLMRHGVNYQDEPYQMLNALEWRSAPLAPLSAWLGHMWADTFGFTLLSMRALAAACALLSAAAASALYGLRSRCPLYAVGLFGVTTILMALSPWLSYLYGWDAQSSLCLTLLAIALLRHLQAPGVLTAAAVGIMLAAAALARVPNAVAIVPALALLAWPRGRRMAWAVTAVLTACAVALAAICAMYGSPAAYAAALRDNVITGHSLAQLLRGYGAWLSDFASVGALTVAVLAACRMISRGVASRMAWLLVALAGALAGTVTMGHLTEPGHVVHAAAIVCLAILLCRSVSVASALVIAAVALVASAGSDMGLVKMLCVPLLPLAMAYVPQQRSRAATLALVAVTAMCAVAELTLQADHAFEDRGFRHTTVTLTSTPLAGVRTTAERAAEIHALDSVITSVRQSGAEVLAAGDCYRYVVDLLARRPRPAAMRHAYLIDYPSYIPALRQCLTEAPAGSVAIVTRPFDWRISLPAHSPGALAVDTTAIRSLSIDYLRPVILTTPKFAVHPLR